MEAGILDRFRRPKTGLILSGGGARAAYQVGVLRAVANFLPRQLPNPYAVITGTSAGALNATALASHAWHFGTAVRSMEVIWKQLRSEQVYDPQSANLLGSASNALLALLGSSRSEEKPVALFDNTPLSELLSRVIRLKRIQRNIDSGHLDAISVTASAYGSGQSCSFFQAMQGLREWTGPHRIGKQTRLQLQHLMASCAIPLVFPAVKIGSQYFGDGAIRQFAPVSTALHLGARRLFAIGVSGNQSGASQQEDSADPPGLVQVFGHILNSAFVDHLENDLGVLRNLNRVLAQVSEPVRHRIGKEMHEVELLEIAPSRAINKMALEHYEELPRPLSRFVKPEGSGTLLSLILFETGFCRALMKLGFEDAQAMETDIRRFLGETGC